MESLPNVVVRLSSDSIDGETISGATTSTICHSVETAPEGATVCEAYTRGGKCGTCRACFSKDVPVVAYPAHGAKLLKMIKVKVKTK